MDIPLLIDLRKYGAVFRNTTRANFSTQVGGGNTGDGDGSRDGHGDTRAGWAFWRWERLLTDRSCSARRWEAVSPSPDCSKGRRRSSSERRARSDQMLRRPLGSVPAAVSAHWLSSAVRFADATPLRLRRSIRHEVARANALGVAPPRIALFVDHLPRLSSLGTDNATR